MTEPAMERPTGQPQHHPLQITSLAQLEAGKTYVLHRNGRDYSVVVHQICAPDSFGVEMQYTYVWGDPRQNVSCAYLSDIGVMEHVGGGWEPANYMRRLA